MNPSARNAHGVYLDGATVTLSARRKGGLSLAQISVALTPAGWRSATSFAFSTGDMWGASSPITDHSPAFPERAEALADAADKLAGKISRSKRPDTHGEARAILEWCATFRPAQADLFGLAA